MIDLQADRGIAAINVGQSVVCRLSGKRSGDMGGFGPAVALILPVAFYGDRRKRRIQGKTALMASGNNMKAHKATYEGFLGLVKWGTPAVALIAALVIFLITRHH